MVLLFTGMKNTALPQNHENNNSILIDTGYVIVDGGKLYYEAAGTGDCLVLLHDGIVHSTIWDEQFLEFARKYRVIRYDRRTYGKSSDPETLYSHIEDLNQVFTQLNINKAVVFGMSSGGRLAIDFALKYPEKVDGLVLVGAAVSGYGYSQHLLSRGGRIDLNNFSNPDDLINLIITEDPYEFYMENIQAKQKVMKMLESTKPSHGVREEGKEKLLVGAERPAINFLLEIQVPTLILVGEFDIPDVHAFAGAINAGIANSIRDIVPKAGHLIPIEQPEYFNKRVDDFFRVSSAQRNR